MAKLIKITKYSEASKGAVSLGTVDLDKKYTLHQRWGRFGEPEVDLSVQLSPDDCWTIGEVRVWVFVDVKGRTYGLSPEAYLKDWFLVSEAQS